MFVIVKELDRCNTVTLDVNVEEIIVIPTVGAALMTVTGFRNVIFSTQGPMPATLAEMGLSETVSVRMCNLTTIATEQTRLNVAP